MKTTLTAALVAVTTLAACADKSANISASYVSPSLYDSMNCRQLGEEAHRVAANTRQAVKAQDRKADNDAAATAVSLLLFWPAAFMIQGDDHSAAEVARMKGEMQALEQASIRKNCNINFGK